MSLILGVFTAGEIPAPLVYGFEDADGNPLNLTGFDAKFAFRRRAATPIIRPADITNHTGGQVTYTWQEDDMAVANSRYSAEFVVDDAVNRYTSEPIRWRVRSAVAAVTFP